MIKRYRHKATGVKATEMTYKPFTYCLSIGGEISKIEVQGNPDWEPIFVSLKWEDLKGKPYVFVNLSKKDIKDICRITNTEQYNTVNQYFNCEFWQWSASKASKSNLVPLQAEDFIAANTPSIPANWKVADNVKQDFINRPLGYFPPSGVLKKEVKDWQLVSFIAPDGKEYKDKLFELYDFEKFKGCIITKVRCVSTGVEICVGDDIVYLLNCVTFTVDRFRYEDNNLLICLKSNLIQNYIVEAAIDQIKLAPKEPILTTHDGVKIYDKEQEFCCIHNTTFEEIWIKAKYHKTANACWIWFSTKAAAEKYIHNTEKVDRRTPFM